MALQVKLLHHTGDTVTVYAAVTKVDLGTKAFSASNCDSGYPKLTISDPDGVAKVSDQEMTLISGSTGEYFWTYQLVSPTKGDWSAKVVAKVTIASVAQIEEGYCHFEVV